MSKPRVFVVNEPATKAGGKTIDLSPACEHGELIFLSPAGDAPLDLEPAIERMAARLIGFTKEDYLLPVGHPMLIAAAGALAARASGGCIKMLIWRGSSGRYVPVVADMSFHFKETK